MDANATKEMAKEAIRARYKELEESFPTKEEFNEWIEKQVKEQADLVAKQVGSFMTRFEAFQSKLTSMTGSVITFAASGPTYLASAAAATALGDSNATARALAEYNTAAAQLKGSVKDCTISSTELSDEAEGLMIKSLPGFSTLWRTFEGVVNAYISACNAIQPISG